MRKQDAKDFIEKKDVLIFKKEEIQNASPLILKLIDQGDLKELQKTLMTLGGYHVH